MLQTVNGGSDRPYHFLFYGLTWWLVYPLLFFILRHRLIQRQINLIGLIRLPLLDLRHRRAKGLEVIRHRLID